MSNFGNERVVGVWVSEHGADRKKHYVKHINSSRMVVKICIFLLPLEMVNAGLHWSRRMSKQMLPFELMFG